MVSVQGQSHHVSEPWPPPSDWSQSALSHMSSQVTNIDLGLLAVTLQLQDPFFHPFIHPERYFYTVFYQASTFVCVWVSWGHCWQLVAPISCIRALTGFESQIGNTTVRRIYFQIFYISANGHLQHVEVAVHVHVDKYQSVPTLLVYVHLISEDFQMEKLNTSNSFPHECFPSCLNVWD